MENSCRRVLADHSGVIWTIAVRHAATTVPSLRVGLSAIQSLLVETLILWYAMARHLLS